jgi:hypothetical protein
MYIAKVAPADKRGNLVSWNQFAIIFGMLVVYFVNLLDSFARGCPVACTRLGGDGCLLPK